MFVQKADLINELSTSPESALTILRRGYLKHFPVDDEVYLALREKLAVEAQKLAQRLQSTLTGALDATLASEISELEHVVQNTILSRLQQEPVISQWTKQIQSLVRRWIPKVDEQRHRGFEFLQDQSTGDFKIVNIHGTKVYETPFIATKAILQEWGLATTDPLFDLFYFTLLPAEDLPHYRELYCFSTFFHFN